MTDTNQLLNEAMLMLAGRWGAIFIGQNVAYEGNVMFEHLNGVRNEQRLELPVFEDMQTGIATGLAIQGFLPISIYPRFNFLLLACSQLVLHLDKLELMSRGQFSPKVILRTRVGSTTPLDAGPQHTGSYTEQFRGMLKNVVVDEIRCAAEILPTYRCAIERRQSTLIVENFG